MRSSLRSTSLILVAALLLLLVGEALRVYWIMPFPGSQRGQTLDLAFALHRGIWALRIAAGAVALWAAAQILARGGRVARVATVLALAGVGYFVYQVNGPMSAEVMFRQPQRLTFATARDLGMTGLGGTSGTTESSGSGGLPPAALVVGIELADAQGRSQARAYPIRYLGYHHQVRDLVAGQPVMVTYCTVCRTGRVYRPVVNDRVESFRLVGMDHFNAMFEDATTGSWWRQATGEAVTGARQGQRLDEVPSRQMSWGAWAALHPETDVMQPDPQFAERYARMAGFDDGTNESTLTGRDPRSWQEKSWVVGVVSGGAGSQARAFDWNELVRERVITDRVGDRPVVLLLDADDASFHAFEGAGLDLAPAADRARFVDRATGTTWSAAGVALAGPRAGERLSPLPAYQEFWHSWRTFHPETTARRN